MRPARRLWFLFLLGLLLVACSAGQASELATQAPGTVTAAAPVPSATAPPAAASLPAPTPTPEQEPEPAPATAIPGIQTEEPASTPVPAPCTAEVCYYPDQFSLAWPIAPPGRDQVDPSYAYGSTQGGLRDPHHGVELLNPAGTPVLATYAGVVEVAGDDRLTFYGPYSYFYGNLVVLRHALPGYEQPVYTLYGHLSQILVQEGQPVEQGQEIGRVGMSGVATGSHLHFEVRFGENLYQRTSNPELWLRPHQAESGEMNGGMAVRALDAAGNPVEIESAVVQRLDGPGGVNLGERYPQVYEEKNLAGQAPFEESFAAGDLAPGWYRVSFAYRGVQQREFQVLPGQLIVLTFEF